MLRFRISISVKIRPNSKCLHQSTHTCRNKSLIFLYLFPASEILRELKLKDVAMIESSMLTFAARSNLTLEGLVHCGKS